MSEPYYTIARSWRETNVLSESDQALLKAEYLRQIGAEPNCRTCGNVLFDIRQHFFHQLKQLDKVANKQSKYILKGGFMIVPGDNVAYVTEPPFNDNRLELTEEIGDELAVMYPHIVGEMMTVNPNFNPETGAVEAAVSEDMKTAEIARLTQELTEVKQERTTLKGKVTRLENQVADYKAAQLPNVPKSDAEIEREREEKANKGMLDFTDGEAGTSNIPANRAEAK